MTQSRVNSKQWTLVLILGEVTWRTMISGHDTISNVHLTEVAADCSVLETTSSSSEDPPQKHDLSVLCKPEAQVAGAEERTRDHDSQSPTKHVTDQPIRG